MPPFPLPIRVLVKGSSPVTWLSWMGGPRTDLALSRSIEAELFASGHPADVQCTGVLGELTKRLLHGFEQEVVQRSPDVVVVMAGQVEAIHLFLPHWFERFSNRVDRRPGRFRVFFWRKVVRSMWKVFGTLQAKVDAALPNPSRTRRLRRAVRDLEGYIALLGLIGTPRIYVLELLPPAGHMTTWFPGMDARIRYINDELRALMKRCGDHVHLVPVSEIAMEVAGDDPLAATPDGIHYTPALHRAIGATIARDVAAWADTQSHLNVLHDPS